ncbi:MAG TPA: anti-sigma factor RsbA family regulatory protein [Nocardioidaceae bacterium]
MSAVPCAADRRSTGFEHEAVFYEGADGLVPAVLPFIREGVARGEQVLVALVADHTAAVEAALGREATRVDFVDMAELGANPACIIPEWRRFLDDAGRDGPVRGVAGPVWSGRRAPEIEEAVLHEALLNLAFDGGPAWQLLCPFDVATLPAEIVEQAARNHPLASGVEVSTSYAGIGEARERFRRSLVPPPASADALPFGAQDLGMLRRLVERRAGRAGVRAAAADDLVLAAHELATNSVLHGGGHGVLRTWSDGACFAVQVDDTGVIDDPLVGRDLLQDFAENGRGIWMANQLCDLVQVRSGPSGTVVRIFAWL